MNVSVIVPWRAGDPQRERIWAWLRRRWADTLPEAQLCVADSEPSRPFNRAEARNNAFALAEHDVLVIADADTLFNWDQIRQAVSILDSVPWVIPYGWYYNLGPQPTEQILAVPPDAVIPTPTAWVHKIVSWAGLAVVRRDCFVEVGGYDERFGEVWGWEDNAFRLALDAVCGPFQRLDRFDAIHLWHAPGLNFEAPGAPANRALYRRYEVARSRPAMRRLVAEHRSLAS